MESIPFEGHNRVWAKDQPQYQPLPAHVDDTDQAITTFCWKPTPEELAEINRTGVIWHQVLTFGGRLQPQRLSAEKPKLGPGDPALPFEEPPKGAFPGFDRRYPEGE